MIIPILQIVWIDILLSGDNAVVIALAVRNLPEHQRKRGILLGTAAAIILRIIFAIAITYLLQVPYLKIVGGLLLFWIAAKMLSGDEGHGEIKGAGSLREAVKTIAVADGVMSLDNVLAVSAAAHGNIWLFVFGIVLSIPLIVFGSQMVLSLLTRFPILVWLGAALLGWIAGDMISNDPVVLGITGPQDGLHKYLADAVGALFVLAAGFFLKWRAEKSAHEAQH